jgi:hypothetical protein
MVISNSGACIQGAVVEIVGGQGVGRRMTQTEPCSWWDPGQGFIFADLIPDLELTIRASAAGYGTKESTLKPSLTRNAWDLSHLAVVELNRAE